MYKHARSVRTALDAPTIDLIAKRKEEIRKAFNKKFLINGMVVRIETYGAFVDIGKGLKGLLHISNIKNDYVNSPHDYFKIGQEIKAYVIKIDEDQKAKTYKVSLSTKSINLEIDNKSFAADPVKIGQKNKANIDVQKNTYQGYSIQDLLNKFKKNR